MSAVVQPRVIAAIYDWLRVRWRRGFQCRSDAFYAFSVSAVWLVFYNYSFWSQTLHAMARPSPQGVTFLGSLLILALCLQAVLLLLMPTQRMMRAVASLCFVIASLSSYFVQEYGVLMNKDMMRNVLGTDMVEVADLINVDLILRVALLGVLPAWLVWRVSLPQLRWAVLLRHRLYAIAVALTASAAVVLLCSADYAVFLREHKPIRFALVPAAPLLSAVEVVRSAQGASCDGPLQDLGGMATRIGAPRKKPLLLFIVVGETARAANFQLAGYPRHTTPRLVAMNDVFYFSDVTSCGTSTAISVPCMFSPFDRAHFDPDGAPQVNNVLDSLVDAGFEVEWRDNNAGCKGVCARVRTIGYQGRSDPDRCEHSYCFDEIMLADLRSRIAAVKRDTVIVFHQIGSHGPAYSQRYPRAFERFSPACHSNKLHTCSEQEVVNAYDNSIAYTDHVLARQIELLDEATNEVDSILIYVSDHGESLGENRVYLHGMPYALAPRVQKHVPMLLWASSSYTTRMQLDTRCLRDRTARAVTHDNLYHTVLGAAEVRDAIYQPAMDILMACRRIASKT